MDRLGRNCLPLLEQLSEEFEANALGSGLRLIDRKIEVRRRARFHLPDCPVIVLDATGEPELYAQVLGRDVEELRAAPELQVVPETNQLALSVSQTSLRSNTSYREQIFEAVGLICQQAEGDVALIAAKQVLEMLPSDLRERLAFAGHYYNLRGLNAVEDVEPSDFIVLGTPEPNPEGLQAMVEALDLQPHGLRRVHVDLDFPTVHGPWSNPVRVYRDGTLRLWHQTLRENELHQAAYRIRPMTNVDTTVWLFTNLPIEGLPPNRVFTSANDLLDHLR
ncbi:MAG: hypothetical protein AAF627_09880 [Myxococcota bacterium]